LQCGPLPRDEAVRRGESGSKDHAEEECGPERLPPQVSRALVQLLRREATHQRLDDGSIVTIVVVIVQYTCVLQSVTISAKSHTAFFFSFFFLTASLLVVIGSSSSYTGARRRRRRRRKSMASRGCPRQGKAVALIFRCSGNDVVHTPEVGEVQKGQLRLNDGPSSPSTTTTITTIIIIIVAVVVVVVVCSGGVRGHETGRSSHGRPSLCFG